MSARQAAGVVPATAPWNAPTILGVRTITVPLAYGNTVALQEAGFPPVTPRYQRDHEATADLAPILIGLQARGPRQLLIAKKACDQGTAGFRILGC